MNSSMSCSDGRWCTRTDSLLSAESIHVSSVTATATGQVLCTETGEDITGCPDCGVVALGHDRRQVRLDDIACFGRPVRLMRAERIWRCPDWDSPKATFTEELPLAGPRARLSSVAWATYAR